jgi:hypothetical protein
MRETTGWRQKTLSLLLILTSAICFLKYLGWAWVVSGNYGTSHSGLVLLAQHRSLAYLWTGLLVEAVLVTILTVGLKFEISELTAAPKAVLRILTALAIAGIGTLSIMLLLSWARRLFR